MDPKVLASEKNFQVWVKDGGIHSGHDTETAAEATCKQANKSAEEQGLKTRYEIKTL